MAKTTPAITPRSTLGEAISVAANVPTATAPCTPDCRAIRTIAFRSIRR